MIVADHTVHTKQHAYAVSWASSVNIHMITFTTRRTCYIYAAALRV